MVSRASRQYPGPGLGGSRPPVAPAVSTPNHAARRMSAAPAVSTRRGSKAFSPAKGQYLPLAVTVSGAYCTVASESGHTKSFLQTDRFKTC